MTIDASAPSSPSAPVETLASVHTLLPLRGKQLIQMLDRAMLGYQSDGGTYADGISSAFGYLIGLAMRDFGWTPAQVGDNVLMLAQQIAEAHARMSPPAADPKCLIVENPCTKGSP